MATITKIHGKNGLSFKITVHCGYDEYYRKRRHYKTYRPPATWSEQYAEREAQRIAVEFENSIRQVFGWITAKPLRNMPTMSSSSKNIPVQSTAPSSCTSICANGSIRRSVISN